MQYRVIVGPIINNWTRTTYKNKGKGKLNGVLKNNFKIGSLNNNRDKI